MKVPDLKEELAGQGLSDKGKKAELAERVTAARTDLAAVREAQAVPLARRLLPKPVRSSPRRTATAGGSTAPELVEPTFSLPGPYHLLVEQRVKRKTVPGEKKYTSTTRAKAEAAQKAGLPFTPLKQRKRPLDEPAPGPVLAEEGGSEEDMDDE